MNGFADEKKPIFLTRSETIRMLGITKHEFFALIEAGKLHPLKTAAGYNRIPLAEVISLKGEYGARTLTVPFEKFVKASSFFTPGIQEMNLELSNAGLPPVPIEYLERIRTNTLKDPEPRIIKASNAREFFTSLGRAEEILKHPDLRMMVELLHMILRGEEEIRQAIRAKFGREYGPEDVVRYIEYFFNWRVMDPDSAAFYFALVKGREQILKQCAFRRADYFIFYSLGIDFGGEIADLLERSCLGLLHKLNIYVDGYIYGDLMVGQGDIQKLADLISTLLGAASQVRAGRVPKSKQPELVETMIPKAFSREEFLKSEKSLSFLPPKEAPGA